MTFTTFITLLGSFSLFTGLATQGVKIFLEAIKFKYSSNIVAVITACIIGMGGTSAYYILASIPFTAINIVCIILMGICSALGAMVGYDKVIQTIKQFKENRGE